MLLYSGTMNKHFGLLLITTALLLSACGDGGFQGPQLQELNGADEIVGGEEINRGDTRGFYVAKLEVDVGKDTFYCTATHVSETILITAAHCLPTKDTKSMKLIYRTHAWAGESRLVKKILIHEDYPRIPKSDLAFIKIYGLKPETQHILPFNFERPTNDSFNILSIGFGITNFKKTSDADGKGLGILRAVESRVTGYSVKLDDFYIDMSKGKGINGGDSGGPAIYMLNGTPTILGIARSVDYHTQGKTKIFDSYGYYTALSYHKDWVLKNFSTLEKSF
jgi:secreted trypsin-like serine protease